MKKIVAAALAAMMLSLSACGSSAASNTVNSMSTGSQKNEAPAKAEYNFTIGTSATSSSAIGQTMQKFAELAAEKSDGRISVTCYPDSQLGGDAELVEGVQLGNVTFVIGNTAPQVSFIPEFAVFDAPCAYADIDQAQTVLANFSKNLKPSFTGTGMHLGQIFPTVFRWMSSNKNIEKMDDFKGIKIRTMTNTNHMAFWNDLGATATPLDFSELYVGLQQGLVDAQENPLDIFLSSKFYEQQKYVVNTQHIAFVASILMNEEAWSELPEDLQEIMTECFTEAGQFATETAQSAEAENIAKVEAEGVTVVELSEELHDQMRQAGEPVYQAIREQVGDELMDSYLNAIEAAK